MVNKKVLQQIQDFFMFFKIILFHFHLCLVSIMFPSITGNPFGVVLKHILLSTSLPGINTIT